MPTKAVIPLLYTGNQPMPNQPIPNRPIAIQTSPAGTVPIPGGFSIVECLQTYHRPITAKELQPILGVTRSHLYAMSKNGDIPAIHLPGSKRIQFEPAVIIAWYRKYSGSRKPVRRVG